VDATENATADEPIALRSFAFSADPSPRLDPFRVVARMAENYGIWLST
jgi:hypothetical protein